MKKTSSLLALILLLFSHGSFAESDGGSHTGGGNICTINGKPVLLELATHHEQFNLPGVKLEKTKLMDLLGFDLLPLRDSAATARAVEYLDRASNAAPKATKLLKSAITKIDFLGMNVNRNKSLRADFSGQTLCTPQNTVAAVIYLSSGYAFLSVPIFNKMDLDSQAGLLIHETLRRIQLTYKGDGTDSELQAVTRSIIINGGEKLDEHPFFAEFFSGKANAKHEWKKMCNVIRKLGEVDAKYSAQSQVICGVPIGQANFPKNALDTLLKLFETLYVDLELEKNGITPLDTKNPRTDAFKAIGGILSPKDESRSQSEITLKDLNQLSQSISGIMSFGRLREFAAGKHNMSRKDAETGRAMIIKLRNSILKEIVD